MVSYFTTPQFIETAIITITVLAVLIATEFFIKNYYDKRPGKKNNRLVVMKIWRTIKLTIVILICMGLLSLNGIHMGKYLAGVGIASAIAGFALQDPIKDIISGMTILLENQFKIGDVVEYKGELGKVVAFNIKTTWLFMIADEKTLVISNRNISEIAISSDWIDVDVPIGYDIDLHYSRSLCREAAKRIERLRYVYSCDFVNTQNLAESWVEYRLRIHCMPEKKYVVRRNAYAVIQDVFYEHNTEFPLSIKVIYNHEDEGKATEGGSEKVINISTAPQKKKADYELGRGAAKSKVCTLDKSNKSITVAMNEAERYARAENLGNKMKLRLRLLSEEVVSFTNILTDIESGQFYIQREGTDYEICLDALAAVSSDAHEKLVAVSSSGTNEAYGGISGLIKKAVDSMVMKGRDASDSSDEDISFDKSIIKGEDDLQWSYNVYREQQKAANAGMAFEDSLEMSVLSKFSDDIKIAVRANYVNIRILVKNVED